MHLLGRLGSGSKIFQKVNLQRFQCLGFAESPQVLRLVCRCREGAKIHRTMSCLASSLDLTLKHRRAFKSLFCAACSPTLSTRFRAAATDFDRRPVGSPAHSPPTCEGLCGRERPVVSLGCVQRTFLPGWLPLFSLPYRTSCPRLRVCASPDGTQTPGERHSRSELGSGALVRAVM